MDKPSKKRKSTHIHVYISMYHLFPMSTNQGHKRLKANPDWLKRHLPPILPISGSDPCGSRDFSSIFWREICSHNPERHRSGSCYRPALLESICCGRDAAPLIRLT